MLKIENNRLKDTDSEIDFVETKNQGGVITPELIVLHTTCSRTLMSTVRWFQSEQSKASAHIIIGRDGKCVQMVDFNTKAWHVGQSAWHGKAKCNDFSIGIEICNWGKIIYKDGGYRSTTGDQIDVANVVELPHKFWPTKKYYWEKFTDEQMVVCKNICKCLAEAYGISHITGHEDVATPQGRKVDPGPAFPMSAVRIAALGKDEEGGPDPFDLEQAKVLMEVKDILVTAVKKVDLLLNRRAD